MADIYFLAPTTGETVLPIHLVVLSRAIGLTGVVDGNRLTASGGMHIKADEGRIRIDGLPIDVSEINTQLDASDTLLNRIDVILRDADGAVQVLRGDNAIIVDENGLEDWHQYFSPVAKEPVPDGAILGLVFIGANASELTTKDIWMMAGPVGNIITTASSPGADTAPLSEKASVATFAPAARGVTGGDSHNHYGGDGGQIDHIKLDTIGTNTHSQIDAFISSKAAVSGLASLDGSSKVVQLPADIVTEISNPGYDTKLPTEQAVRELMDAFRIRNHAWNSSFEFFLGTAACLGWGKLDASVTVAQDTGIRDGYGGVYALKITSAGSGKEGVSQTLKSLKASTIYTVRVWMKATAGDTARAFTTGASSNLSITSTSTTGEWKTGTFTTDATPTDVILKLGSDNDTDIVWFDCLTITEGSEIPSVYRKDQEWDAPKQIPFGRGDGISVITTGQIAGFKQAQDNYKIVGWILTSDLSATITLDVWKKSTYPPANGDSLGTTKPAISAGTSNSAVPDWTVTEITKGDWLGVEIEANDLGKAIDFFLLVRRR